jgi:hypothetical protein
MRNGPYILVLAPDDYPGKRYRGRYVYEHILVWWQNTGQIPPKGKVVHHKNENKHDNRFDNLELKTRKAHSLEHHPPKLVKLQCGWCNEWFERSACQHRFLVKQGQKLFFCCRSHQVSHQQARRRLVG